MKLMEMSLISWLSPIGTKEKVSVLLYHEIILAVIERRSAVYGPFIFKLICHCWAEKFNGERLDLVPDELTIHPTKKLKIKDHKVPEPKPFVSEEPVVPSAPPPGEEPSWFIRLTAQLKKACCFFNDIQDCLYDAHVQQKKAAQRQKAIMRSLSLPVSEGSEENIIEKDEWISKQSNWFDGIMVNDATDEDPQHSPPYHSDSAEEWSSWGV